MKEFYSARLTCRRTNGRLDVDMGHAVEFILVSTLHWDYRAGGRPGKEKILQLPTGSQMIGWR